jgi:peroxiredoxin (alkyl hydroperoxide reductase subunit C)
MSVLIGRPAPVFKAQAVIDGKEIQDFHLSDYLQKQKIVLFFYPADFTFVCPTEMHAFQDKLDEFQKRDTIVVSCSVDNVHSHYAWLQTPKSSGGIQGITYPVVSDIHKTISQDYDVLSSEGIAYRGVFLIDKQGIVRHQLVNDLFLGRDIFSLLNLIDALDHHEKHGEVCPANWRAGDEAIKATPESVSEYLSKQ